MSQDVMSQKAMSCLVTKCVKKKETVFKEYINVNWIQDHPVLTNFGISLL
jgi:hypothetical protein